MFECDYSIADNSQSVKDQFIRFDNSDKNGAIWAGPNRTSFVRLGKTGGKKQREKPAGKTAGKPKGKSAGK